MPYNITEDNWSEDFDWFLIDNGEILYAFKSHESAENYMRSMYINHWFLTDLKNITHETMLDPKEHRCWNEKVQTCIEWAGE